MASELISLKIIDDNPYQDRAVYKDIEALGRIIASEGLQSPPKARPVDGRYQLQFGHRRKRAFEWLSQNWNKEGLTERYTGYTMMPVELEALTDQQMFDGVVIENVHRDDLKVTEKARLLKRYKEVHPTATSAAIGLVFNMNAATVRGMDIFLDLPQAVQDKLDDGTISMATARTLHSIQKIAPESVIVKTLKEIEKGEAPAEAEIENEISRLKNVVEMWDADRREGKPRSSWKNGWLLDMKNFPNKLLPELTAEEAALDAEQQAHLVNPPACTACPFYTKIRGTHYCGMKNCHTRKTTAWYAETLQQASNNLGIAIYETTDGAFRILDEYRHRSLFEKKDKGLRLVPSKLVNGRHYQYFKGIDADIALVVAVGPAIAKVADKAGGKTVGGKMTEKEKAERRAMKVYRVRRIEMMWECTAVTKSMFDAVPLAVLQRLCAWHNIGIDDRIPEEYAKGNSNSTVKAEYQRRALVWRLLKEGSSHYRRSTMAAIVKDMQERTGIKPTKTLINLAAQWDAEIDAAAKGVAVETAKR